MKPYFKQDETYLALLPLNLLLILEDIRSIAGSVPVGTLVPVFGNKTVFTGITPHSVIITASFLDVAVISSLNAQIMVVVDSSTTYVNHAHSKSTIRELNCSVKKLKTGNVLQVSIPEDKSQITQLKMYNSCGKLCVHRDVIGRGIIDVPVNLHCGGYVIQIINGTKQIVRKVVVY